MLLLSAQQHRHMKTLAGSFEPCAFLTRVALHLPRVMHLHSLCVWAKLCLSVCLSVCVTDYSVHVAVGVVEIDNVTLLELEDVAKRYRHPSIIDIKLGFRTWYPTADQRYIDKCKAKDASTTQAALGFKICGMQVLYNRRSCLGFTEHLGHSPFSLWISMFWFWSFAH